MSFSAVSGSQGARRGPGPSDPAARQGDILPEVGGRGDGDFRLHGLHTSGTEQDLDRLSIANGARTPFGSASAILFLYVVTTARAR